MLVPFPLLTMMPTDSYQPLQLKGEIMDLEFTIDTDHRLVAVVVVKVTCWKLLADLLTVAPLYHRNLAQK